MKLDIKGHKDIEKLAADIISIKLKREETKEWRRAIKKRISKVPEKYQQDLLDMLKMNPAAMKVAVETLMKERKMGS